MKEKRIWICSTCGEEFVVEGNGRVHLLLFKHGVLYQRFKEVPEEFNPSKRMTGEDEK
jgi:hypothetical protein